MCPSGVLRGQPGTLAGEPLGREPRAALAYVNAAGKGWEACGGKLVGGGGLAGGGRRQ